MGGGNNNAQRAAERQEKERQAAIQRSVGSINQVFDAPGRQGQYNDLYSATHQYLTDDLNRQKGQTDRSARFAMARGGHTGGSVAVDTNRRIGEDFLRGTVEADRRAQGAASDLRLQDEQSRMNLIAMAQSGLDATTAASQASSSLQNNLQAGRATATAQGLGDMFGNFGDLYRRSQEAAAERRGQRDVYNLLYQPGFGYGGGK